MKVVSSLKILCNKGFWNYYIKRFEVVVNKLNRCFASNNNKKEDVEIRVFLWYVLIKIEIVGSSSKISIKNVYYNSLTLFFFHSFSFFFMLLLGFKSKTLIHIYISLHDFNPLFLVNNLRHHTIYYHLPLMRMKTVYNLRITI